MLSKYRLLNLAVAVLFVGLGIGLEEFSLLSFLILVFALAIIGSIYVGISSYFYYMVRKGKYSLGEIALLELTKDGNKDIEDIEILDVIFNNRSRLRDEVYNIAEAIPIEVAICMLAYNITYYYGSHALNALVVEYWLLMTVTLSIHMYRCAKSYFEMKKELSTSKVI